MYLINDYRKVEGKKNLKGYVDIYDTVNKWMIPGFSLFANEGKYWLNPPSRSYKNDQGETKYFNLVQMNREDQDNFTKDVLAQLRKYDPNAPKPFVFKKAEPKDDQMDLPF